MSDPLLGEVLLFGGNYAPVGWLAANGQLLKVSDYQALFSVYGNLYGGDGRATFGLPNLQGRVPIGSGRAASGTAYAPGAAGGQEAVFLNLSQLTPHTHNLDGTVTVPANYIHIQTTTTGSANSTAVSTAKSTAVSTANSTAVSTAVSVVNCNPVASSNNPTNNYFATAPAGFAVYSPTYTRTMAPDMVKTSVNTNVNTTVNTTVDTTVNTDVDTQLQLTSQSVVTGSAIPVDWQATVEPAGAGQKVPTMMSYQVISYIVAITGIYPSRQ